MKLPSLDVERSGFARSAASLSGAVFGGKKVRFETKKGWG
jgi:hypothetical protein